MKESFAIKEVINNKPGYYPGYGSRQEAENNLESYRIEGGVYSVVYVREVTTGGITTCYEIPEPKQP